MRFTRGFGWPVAPLLLLAAAGCSRNSSQPPRETVSTRVQPRAADLQEVSLPAMAGVEPALQERLHAAYSSLMAVRDAGATGASLARAYGAVGKLLVAAELLVPAEPYLVNARALDPTEIAWPYFLGHLHRMRNERDAAVAFYQDALQLDPDHVPSLVWLGAVQLDRGDAMSAAAALRRAAARQPESTAALFGLGRAALALGNASEAREHFEAALRSDPAAGRVHYPLAMAYRALGDRAQAEAHLRQWKQAFSSAESLTDAQIPPADPLMEEIGSLLQTAVSFEVQGTQLMDQRRYRDAAAAFRKGLAVAPNDATLHQNLGTALVLAGDDAAGRTEFEEAVRLAPGYSRALFSLAVLDESGGRDTEAIEHYGAALAHDPDNTEARFGLADALRRTGRVAESLPQYEHVIRADAGASQARFGYAMALVRLGRYAEAKGALEDAVRVHPDQPGLPHALARILAAAPVDGVRDGQRALAIVDGLQKKYGDTAALTETFAMALAEAGRFPEAVARQRDAIEAAARQGRADLAIRMRENLRRYEAGQPCRTPWAEDDPVHFPRKRS